MGKRILVVEPHPDDTAIMAGGAIAKLASEGNEIWFVTVTDGERGTMDPNIKSVDELRRITRTEALEAAKILGVKKQLFLGYLNHDVTFELEKELKEKIIKIIREFKPSIVITYDPYTLYEPNPDHRTVAFATYDAVTFSHYHLEYPEHIKEGLSTHIVDEVWFYNTSQPNFFIDVTEMLWTKLKAMAAYRSQMESMLTEVKLRLKSIGFRLKFLDEDTYEQKLLKLWIYPQMENGRLIEKFKVIRPFLSERVGYLFTKGLVEPIMDNTSKQDNIIK